MVKGITDPRSLTDPKPDSEVERGRAVGSETMGQSIVSQGYYLFGFMLLSFIPIYAECSAGEI